jgi:hypothetical protein
MLLVPEGHTEQQRVNQQGEQQRKRHSPAFTAHASAQPLPATCGSRRSLRRRVRWRCLRGPGMLAQGRLLPSPVRL